MSEVISQELFKDVSDAKTRQLLEQVVQRSGLTADEVTTEFMALLEKPHIKKIKASEGSGKSELDAQQNYVAQLLISKYSKRAPMVSFDVIPLGHEGVRKTKSNKFVNSIIAVCMKEGKEPALHAITFWDKEAQNISSSVEFGSLYKSVKLSQNTQTGNLTGDNRTTFENPEEAPIETIYANLGIKQSGMKELFENPTKLDNMGYQVKTDIRMFEGFIKRYNEGLKKNASPDSEDEWDYYRLYNIHMKKADGDIQLSEVLADGTVVNEEITIWIPADQAGIPEGSLVQVIGVARLGNDSQTGLKQVSFNAFHVRPLVLGEKEGDIV